MAEMPRADDDHVLAHELLGRAIVLRVQLRARERASAPGYSGMYGVSHVPVALMIPRADTSPRSVSTRSRSPRSQTTVTLHGPIHRQAERLLVRREVLRHRDARLRPRSASVSTTSEKRIPGRSWMRLTVLSVSDGQRNCHAPPGCGDWSSTTKPRSGGEPAPLEMVGRGQPGLARPDDDDVGLERERRTPEFRPRHTHPLLGV